MSVGTKNGYFVKNLANKTIIKEFSATFCNSSRRWLIAHQMSFSRETWRNHKKRKKSEHSSPISEEKFGLFTRLYLWHIWCWTSLCPVIFVENSSWRRWCLQSSLLYKFLTVIFVHNDSGQRVFTNKQQNNAWIHELWTYANNWVMRKDYFWSSESRYQFEHAILQLAINMNSLVGIVIIEISFG